MNTLSRPKLNESIKEDIVDFMDSVQSVKMQHFGLSELTVEIPINKNIEEHLHLIPENILNLNTISEEGNYFILNGVKVRKNRFFKNWMGCDIPTKSDGTQGRLYFTVDPMWMLRASDPNSVSWRSCYRPNGEYWHSCIHTAASPQFGMLMIVNDKCQIMGRRFVLGAAEPCQEIGELLMLPIYGNMPHRYVAIADEWFIKNILGGEGIVVDVDHHLNELMRNVSIPFMTSSNGWRCHTPDYFNYPNEWWIDGAKRGIVKDTKTQARVNVELDEWWDKDYSYCSCDYCGSRVSDNSITSVEDDYICENCLQSYFFWSEYRGEYIRQDESMEYITRKLSIDYCIEEFDIPDRVEIRVLRILDTNPQSIRDAAKLLVEGYAVNKLSKGIIRHHVGVASSDDFDNVDEPTIFRNQYCYYRSNGEDEDRVVVIEPSPTTIYGTSAMEDFFESLIAAVEEVKKETREKQ